MKKALRWLLGNIEEAITFCFFIVMCVFVALQVFLRYLFSVSIPFAEELARFSYVWVTFIGIAISTKYRQSIQIDFFVGFLSPRGQRIVRIAVDVLSLILLIVLIFFGARYAWRNRIMSSPALEISMFLVHVSFPLGFAIATARIIWLIIRDMRALLAPAPAPPAPTDDQHTEGA